MRESDGSDPGMLTGKKAEWLPPGTVTGKVQYFQAV